MALMNGLVAKHRKNVLCFQWIYDDQKMMLLDISCPSDDETFSFFRNLICDWVLHRLLLNYEICNKRKLAFSLKKKVRLRDRFP